MNITDKIYELRDQLKIKNKTPCPTPILLFLAKGMVYPGRVDPWYSHIKQKELRGAPSYATEFFNAVICGMHPELKDAADSLSEKLIDYHKKNSNLFEESRNKSNRRKIKESFLRITDDVIKEFKLKDAYQVFETTPEQRKHIDENLKVALLHYADEKLGKCLPVVQILSKAIQQKHMDSLETGLGFVQDMTSLNLNIKTGNKGYFNNSKIQGLAEQIFDLQKKGVLDNEFRVKPECKQQFIKSDLVQKFNYNGNVYCLDKRLTEAPVIKSESTILR